jgi:hypothetical protein
MENINPVPQRVNPLAKYFRQPAIYIKLPSGGKYWPEGSLELPITGEIPVYPMTARDEITLRTPDALLNGAGVTEVMQSCCPNIVNAWHMPSIDVDAVLIAIRIASYGENMEIDANCPHCKEENNYSLNLQPLLSTIAMPDYDSPVSVAGLSVKLKPQEFFSINRKNSAAFEEQRLIDAINNESITEEEKIARVNTSMNRLLDLSIDTVSNSTESIVVDGTTVTDPAFIKEFYNNADGTVIRTIQKRIAEISDSVAIKPQDTNCKSCEKEFSIPIEFEYSNFFATGS